MMFNPNLFVKNIVTSATINNSILLVARALASYIFIMAGWSKIAGYAGTAAYMESMGVPSAMLPLAIFVELGGGLAILLGFQLRFVALGLAGFSVVTAFLFHAQPDDAINFMKNLAMTGGFLALMLQGAGKFSLDHLLEKNR